MSAREFLHLSYKKILRLQCIFSLQLNLCSNERIFKDLPLLCDITGGFQFTAGFGYNSVTHEIFFGPRTYCWVTCRDKWENFRLSLSFLLKSQPSVLEADSC